jgi:hypothetical protein
MAAKAACVGGREPDCGASPGLVPHARSTGSVPSSEHWVRPETPSAGIPRNLFAGYVYGFVMRSPKVLCLF